MTAVLWLTVALPLVAAVVVRFAPAGDRLLTVIGAAAATVPACVLLIGAARGETAQTGFAWLAAADIEVGLRLDDLSAAMSVTVATVGLVVMVYATGYFAGDVRRRSALAGLLAFLGAMQGLVLADGYLTLLIFWELVGAASARLIAYNRDDDAAVPGAVRAFLTTRTADLGFYLAVLALFAATGSVAFTEARPDGALGAVVALGLIVAAVGKSAQAPLQTWLAGAMAGPTPVSALLHSATMVAAGVYLLMRSDGLLAGWPLEIVGWIGAVTAAGVAAVALAQDDLKRVLAGSTSSQLGLMFVGLAAGGPAVALFHLVAHAVGKACLFLAAGIFQHERGSTALADLRGVGRQDRAGMACFVLGALSIAAVPPLAGFWSKEHIAAAAEHHVAWFVLVLVATAGAAAYLLRPALMLWRGGPAGESLAAVAGRPAMLAGAGALAAASLLFGLVGSPVRDLLDGRLPTSTLSLVLSLVALAAGVVAVLAAVRVPAALRHAAARDFYSARAQHLVAVRPALAFAAATDTTDRRVVDAAVDGVAHGAVRLADGSEAVERRVVDAAVDGLARLVGAGGRRSRRLQTGRLYEYLRDTALGATAVAVLITLAVAVPLVLAAAVALVPARASGLPRVLALTGGIVALACIAATWVRFDSQAGMQLVEEAEWIPTIGVAWRLGVDGMSLALAALTVVLFLAAMVYGVGPKPMTRAAAALLLLLEAATLAFFLAQDFFLFYVAFDVTLVAMYFLIALWGEENRRYAAIKFFLYTLVGSLPVLLGILALFLTAEPNTFDMRVLAEQQPLAGVGVGATLVFLAFFVGFAIKTPVVPFHTWLPAAHVEAPTAGSVLLAGVLLKMGTYGLVRVNLQMLPDVFAEYALPIALLGVVSALYGALVALAQTDLKRLVAYTSVNHMGYVIVGVAAAAATGVSAEARNLAIDGAVLQMVAHGVVTGALFFIAGFIATRTKTRDLRQLAGLLRPMPVYGTLAAVAFFASLGLPGLAQFPAEFQIFLGTFDVWPAVAAVVLIGIVVTAGLFLRALQQAFLGETPTRWTSLPDLGGRELAAVVPLIVLTVALGVYPPLVLDIIDAGNWLVGG